jgi:mRNA interferase RelE/StbE
MAYKVELTPQAEKDFLSLDKSVAQNIANKMDWFSQNMGSIIPAPLKGVFKGKYKLRIGDWRAIYSLEHTSRVITIYAIRHRSEIYK